ncbi:MULTISPECIES: putative transporter small subunit [Achromobacter]|jgi:cytochrome oxidase assembly protein ShyY1|nr:MULTISPECIES: putative transporter small subunit [Achromobacter]MDH1301704.1 putative transporter small subunit [Achromobacter sp. GD03932]WLW62592.1 putative transporter small subunit [Achromobacter aegrifaciens]
MWLTFYFLVWPAISALILALLCVTLWQDIRAARRSGKAMV